MIVVKISDGLGNQLFQYAYARMLSVTTRQKVYLDISDINRIFDRSLNTDLRLCDIREYQLNKFMIMLPVISEKQLAKVYKREKAVSKFQLYCRELYLSPVVFVREAMIGKEGFHFSYWQNYYIEGFFFDKKYYEEVSELLRNEFKLKEKMILPDEVQKILRERNTVSLHIRRGDFLKIGHDLSQTDYYQAALDYIKDKVRNPFLFIFSDDIAWVKDNMLFDMDYLTISGQGFSDCEELILMSMCRNNIMANSTFSFWGAWLNPNKEKIVTVPRGWRQKVIPNTWIQL